MANLTGKTALITGASRGIGKAVAASFAAAGANVMLSSRKLEALTSAADEIRASGAPGEVDVFVANAGEAEQAAACVAATMTRFGAVDILVNNAATNPYMGPLINLDAPRAEKTVKVNLMGPILWTQLAWSVYMQEHGGVVINISSIGGFYIELGISYYNATKAALNHITRHLAAELAPKVRVNGIAPGAIKTDMARALWEGKEEQLAARIPLGRMGEPSDIADIAVFLASDEASFITGQTIVVDGGILVANRG